MRHRILTTNGSGPSTRSRLLAMLAVLCLVGATAMGCQQEVTVENDGDNDNEVQNDHNHDHNQDFNQVEDPRDDEYYETHGPDDDEVLTDAGSLQGSWRTAFVDGDVPLAYLDIFHDEGETTADGSFLMGIAVGHMLDGTSGQLEMVTVNGESVEIQWNPTTAQEEMYYLTLQRQDDDSFQGTFSAEMYPEEHEAIMTRQEN